MGDSRPGTVLQASRWLLIVLLAISYPLAELLPRSAGWENGWIEHAQLATLIGGFVFALWMHRRANGMRPTHDAAVARRFAAIALPFWLICAARETSWGATLFTPGIPTMDGRYYTSSILWYHPAIAPLVLIVVGCIVLAFVRWRLDRPLLQLVRARRFPWIELGLTLSGAMLSALAEGKFHIALPGPERTLMVMEEGTELLCYAGLLLTQACLFSRLRSMPGPQSAVSPPRA